MAEAVAAAFGIVLPADWTHLRIDLARGRAPVIECAELLDPPIGLEARQETAERLQRALSRYDITAVRRPDSPSAPAGTKD